MIDLKNIKALLIDLDGTLVDSMPLLYSVYREFLHKLGVEGTKEEFDALVGPTLNEAMIILNQRHHFGRGPEELVSEYQELLYHHYTQNLKLFVGARSFLKYAKECGLKLALVTSATEKLALGFLNAEGIENDFDVIVTAKGLQKGKPHPDIYRKALFLMGILPDEAVAVEDSINGIASATSAGIYTLYLNHDGRADQKSRDALVYQVESWADIHNLFRVIYD